MGVLTVRALDDAQIKELRFRAARHGRSAEA
jgi:plasmid stability protein